MSRTDIYNRLALKMLEHDTLEDTQRLVNFVAERKAFEAWMADCFAGWPLIHMHGHYLSPTVQMAWSGWLERAARGLR